MLQVSKKIFLKPDFNYFFFFFFFMIFLMYIACSMGRQPPGEESFDVNRNVLSLHSFVASFKKCLWSLILYNFFHDLIHVYSPGAEVDSPQGTKFWCQQKCLVTSFICCKFQTNLCEVWFYTICSWFYKCDSPKTGADNPLGTKFLCQQEHLVTLVICCKFQKILFEVWLYTFFFFFFVMILYMYIACLGN